MDRTIGIEPWQIFDCSFQLDNFAMGGGYETLPHPINGTGPGTDKYYNAPIADYTQCANITYWLRHDISWSDGVPLTAADINYTDFINAAYGNSWDYSDMSQIVNFVIYDNYTFSVYLDVPSYLAYGLGVEVDFLPMHLYANIVCPNSNTANTNTNPWIATSLTISGNCMTGLQGMWPGAAATASDFVPTFPSYGVTYNNVAYGGLGGNNIGPAKMWVGSGIWKYITGFNPSNPTGMVLGPNSYFFLSTTRGDINFQYTWDSTTAPSGGSYAINLADLTYMANAFGTRGAVIPPATSNVVPFAPPGARGVWNPACDLAPPSGIVGLTDLATMALNYGRSWGGYDQWTFVATSSLFGFIPSIPLTVTQANPLCVSTFTSAQLPITMWCSENAYNLPYSYAWAPGGPGRPIVTVDTATRTITAVY